MKRFGLYAILIAMVTFVACSDDDFDSQLTTNLETETLLFSGAGGEQTFMLESNDSWFVSELPDWLNVEVKDIAEVATRASYPEGIKEVTIEAKANPENKSRTTELTLSTLNGTALKLKVVQDKKPELVGYWILSEGYTGQVNAELAWFDVAKNAVEEKQFYAKNSKPLGDTGNEITIYGSKMYVVVTGAGFGTETSFDNSYIEVINPIDGKSITRIPFKDAKGTPAKPRNIVFEGGKGYISSYSNEVVRLDTATLTLDKHAALSGIMAEGLTFNNGNLYICNGGQGADNKISVVDINEMKETKTIKTPYNPNHILSGSNGDIYFSTDYPDYKLYKLTTAADGKHTEITGLSVADMTYSNNNIYTSYFDRVSFSGSLHQFNTATAKASKFNLDFDSKGMPTIQEYHIGTINGSNNLYLTGMNEEVIIFDPATYEIKHAFKTGAFGGNGVVAVYK